MRVNLDPEVTQPNYSHVSEQVEESRQALRAQGQYARALRIMNTKALDKSSRTSREATTINDKETKNER